jgi:hypothetical protein
MHNLSLASSSLARFQQLVSSEPSLRPQCSVPSQHLPREAETLPNLLRPASFPSPAPSSASSLANPSPAQSHGPPGRKRLHRQDSPEPPTSPSHNSPYPQTDSRSPSVESECCGGIMDCRDLVESEGDHCSINSPRPKSQFPQGPSPGDPHLSSSYDIYQH